VFFIKDGSWFKGDDPEVDKIEWRNGAYHFFKAGFPSIIVIKRVMEPSPLKFSEVQGEVMTGYQEFLESEWVGQLNKKYSVKIDNMVLEEVKKKLKDE